MQNRSFITNIKKGIELRIASLFINPYKKYGISWLKIKELKHLPPGKLRHQQFLNKKISFIAPSEFLYGLKEIFVDEIYKQEFHKDSYIIDCGANIGLSVIYCKEACPGARIVAFEPDDRNFDLLQVNISSFGYSNVLLRKEAVWIENTQLNFTGSGSMSSRIGETQEIDTKIVKAIRLKDLLVETVDFLKIDIEGAEYTVLKDIQENLTQVKNMFIEYHGSFKQTQELTDMLSWITKKGFSYYIKEAAPVYPTPFLRNNREKYDYDVQLNIFCFRTI